MRDSTTVAKEMSSWHTGFKVVCGDNSWDLQIRELRLPTESVTENTPGRGSCSYPDGIDPSVGAAVHRGGWGRKRS